MRKFSTRSVDQNILVEAVKTAHTAPSGANKQPWFFVIVKDQKMKDLIRVEAEKVEKEFYEKKAGDEWLQDLKPFQTDSCKAFLSEAPALILVFYKSRPLGLTRTEMEKTYYPIESTSLATGLLLASLHLNGLATLTHTPKPMSFLNSLVGLDQCYKPLFIIVTGYADESYKAPELHKKNVEEIFHCY